MKRKIFIAVIASAVVLFSNVACNSVSNVDENGYNVISQREYTAIEEESKSDQQERNEARRMENSSSDTDWYVLLEGLRVIREDVGQKMPIDKDCAQWQSKSPEGKFIRYAWKSGSEFYYMDYSCNNYTKGSYPVFELDKGGTLIEVDKSNILPG